MNVSLLHRQVFTFYVLQATDTPLVTGSQYSVIYVIIIILHWSHKKEMTGFLLCDH